MRQSRAALLAAILFSLASTARAETVDDILAMSAKGVGEEILLTTVEQSKTGFTLNAQDVIRLKEKKVPDKVIMAMLKKRAAANPGLVAVAPAPAPAPAAVPAPAPVAEPAPAKPARPAAANGILNIENLDDKTWSYKFEPATGTIWISPASADGQGNIEPHGGLSLRMPLGTFDVVYNGQTTGQPVTVHGEDKSLIMLSRVDTKDLEALYVTVFEKGERKTSGKLVTLRQSNGKRAEREIDSRPAERVVERERVVEVPSTTVVYRDTPTVVYSGSYYSPYYSSYYYPGSYYLGSGYCAPRYYSSYCGPRYYGGYSGYYGGGSYYGGHRHGGSVNFGYTHIGRNNSFGIGVGVGRRW
ncbi:MAG TPA: hypothetical protein VEK08_22120 [Planctomycetota bacterium]|nr:hypothetical protein [Planctomycetota bacterium]